MTSLERDGLIELIPSSFDICASTFFLPHFFENFGLQYPDRNDEVPGYYTEQFFPSIEAARKESGAAVNRRPAGCTPTLSSSVLSVHALGRNSQFQSLHS
jgi:hypothetical protein